MKLPVYLSLSIRAGGRLLLLGGVLPTAQALVLYSTGDPNANTTAPTGPLADSGWQYENSFLSATGYPISNDSFVVSKHIVGGYHTGNVGGTTFTYLGVTYNTVGRWDAPGDADITVLKIDPSAPAGAFPSFVPLYRKSDEVGKDFVVLGKGYIRGAEINIPADATTGASANGTLRGWEWGPLGAGVQRWGQNTVDAIAVANGPGVHQEYLVSTLTPPAQGGLPNEAALAEGDSSGGVFILDTQDGIWKLAALNSGADASFSTTQGGTATRMAVFDAGGLYTGPGLQNQLQDTVNPDVYFNGSLQSVLLTDPTVDRAVGSFHARLSPLVDWLDSVALPEPAAPPVLLGLVFGLGMMWVARRQPSR